MNADKGLRKWSFQEIEGQLVIFCDQTPVMFSALPTLKNETWEVLNHVTTPGNIEGLHDVHRQAIAKVYEFARERNFEAYRTVEFLVEAANALEVWRTSVPLMAVGDDVVDMSQLLRPGVIERKERDGTGQG